MSQRLTPTQRFILTTASSHPDGLVVMGAGDRQGTRVVGRNKLGYPVIVSYSAPEYFLDARGLLQPYGRDKGMLHTYRITDAGRAALKRRAAPEVPDGQR